MKNTKKKPETSRFSQTKAPSARVLSKAKNALPHKGGRQAANKKPSVSDSFLKQAQPRLWAEEEQ